MSRDSVAAVASAGGATAGLSGGGGGGCITARAGAPPPAPLNTFVIIDMGRPPENTLAIPLGAGAAVTAFPVGVGAEEGAAPAPKREVRMPPMMPLAPELFPAAAWPLLIMEPT